MGNVKIISDDGEVYKPDEIISVEQLINDYCECTDDQDLVDFLWRIPIPSAIDFIADAWGIQYEFV